MPSPTGYSSVTLSTLSGGISDALVSGVQWASSVVTYSFPSYQSLWSTSDSSGYGSPYGSGEPWSAHFSPLYRSDKSAVKNVMNSFSKVSQLALEKVDDNSSLVGDIRLAYTATPGAQAWAYLPDTTSYAGDIWFNAIGSSYQYEWKKGSYEYMTALHEVGHALGLKHPFSTTAYNATTIETEFDSRSYTVMSYSAAAGDNDTYFSYEPTTLMVVDIAAIQSLYGVNHSHKSGDSSYLFKENKNYHQTIWDSGGTDEIIYDSSKDGVINLNAGVEGGSSMGKKLSIFNTNGELLDKGINNIWIADGVVIENARGGSGNDTIIGNSSDNTLIGQAGKDTLDGGLGDDRLYGSGGNDVLSGESGNDQLLGGKGADLLSGGEGDDLLKAGRGSDILFGGEGNDILTGGGGSDIFVFDSAPDDSNVDMITDFVSGKDILKFDLSIFDVLSFDSDFLNIEQFLSGADTTAPVTVDQHLIYNSSSGDLFYDSDGSSATQATVKIATFTNLVDIRVEDFSSII